jgi:signal peptidase I
MAILAMTPHVQDPDGSGQVARATSRETLGCELAAEVIRSFGSLRLRVVGASMLPAVWPGDLLSVRSDDAAEAVPGDIVVFKREGRLVAHRVVEIKIQDPGSRTQDSGFRRQGQSPIANHQSPIDNRQSAIDNFPGPVSRIEFVTRGDRVGRNDAPISRHELLGRVTAIERGSRRINPRLTFWSRIASAILSRSEFCTSLVLRVGGWGLGVGG